MRPRPRRPWRHLACAVSALAVVVLAATGATAEEVKVEHLGLELVGNLERAGRDLAAAPPVVVIVHDALSFHGAEGPRALQAALTALRQPSLAITLSLGIEARRRPFDCTFEHDHRDGDATQELAAWTQWLITQGVTAVVFAGEGRGALQVAIEPEAPDGAGGRDVRSAIRGLVLVAPAPSDLETRAADYRTRFQADLDQILAEANRVATEAGEDTSITVPGFLGCARSRVTAGAFLDAYDPQRAPDLVALLRARSLPVLAFLADHDPRRNRLTAPTAGGATIGLEKLSTAPVPAGPLAAPEIAAAIARFAGRFRP